MTSQDIIDLRKKLQLSQIEFAKKIGVSFATVNRWENSKHVPSHLAIEKIQKLKNNLEILTKFDII